MTWERCSIALWFKPSADLLPAPGIPLMISECSHCFACILCSSSFSSSLLWLWLWGCDHLWVCTVWWWRVGLDSCPRLNSKLWYRTKCWPHIQWCRWWAVRCCHGWNNAFISVSRSLSCSGHYMHIEASGVPPGEIARLVSPELTSGGPFCLTFYYHLYGHHIGELRVEELLGSVNDNPLNTQVAASYTLADTAGMFRCLCSIDLGSSFYFQ